METCSILPGASLNCRAPGATLAQAINEARTPFIGFLPDGWQHLSAAKAAAEAALRDSIWVCGRWDASSTPKPAPVDLLKYWLPGSMLEPAAVFARTEFVQAAAAEGPFMEPASQEACCWELLLRMARRQPASVLPEQLAVSADQREGGRITAAARARIFRRYAALLGDSHKKCSFVIPAAGVSQLLKNTIECILTQSFPDFEIVIAAPAPFGKRSAAQRELAQLAHEYNLAQQQQRDDNYLLCACAEGGGWSAAINEAVRCAGGELLLFLKPGSIVSSNTCLEAANLFAADELGCAAAASGCWELRQHFKEQPRAGVGAVPLLFSAPAMNCALIVRKAALIDAGGLAECALDEMLIKALLLRVLNGGWQVSMDNRIAVVPPAPAPDDQLIPALRNYVNAALVMDLASHNRSRPGVQQVCFPEPLVASAEKLLQTAPEEWQTLKFAASFEALRATVASHPSFAPAWQRLSQECSRRGLHDEARQAAFAHETALREEGSY